MVQCAGFLSAVLGKCVVLECWPKSAPSKLIMIDMNYFEADEINVSNVPKRKYFLTNSSTMSWFSRHSD